MDSNVTGRGENIPVQSGQTGVPGDLSLLHEKLNDRSEKISNLQGSLLTVNDKIDQINNLNNNLLEKINQIENKVDSFDKINKTKKFYHLIMIILSIFFMVGYCLNIIISTGPQIFDIIISWIDLDDASANSSIGKLLKALFLWIIPIIFSSIFITTLSNSIIKLSKSLNNNKT